MEGRCVTASQYSVHGGIVIGTFSKDECWKECKKEEGVTACEHNKLTQECRRHKRAIAYGQKYKYDHTCLMLKTHSLRTGIKFFSGINALQDCPLT